jgi:urease subunit gamma/beta
MHLTPKEMDRLTIFTAAELARRRRGRGLRLNYPEAVALLCDEMMEAARDGRNYDEVVELGMSLLTPDDVMDGVPELIDVLQVEPAFVDGTKLIVLRHPIASAAPLPDTAPGAIRFAEGDIAINAGRPVRTLSVGNPSAYPIQVTSHMHFAEANAALVFDRDAARGHRLDVPAGTAVRWEPGQSHEVRLVPFVTTNEPAHAG